MTFANALRYHDLGLCVIPIPKGSKRPVIGWKRYQQQRPTPEQLRAWFAADDQNMGIVCGEISGGLVVRDFDSNASFNAWTSMHVDLARTLPIVTTSRGSHVYARADAAAFQVFGDGELRSEGHIVVAPNSVHPSGEIYSWATPIEQLLTVDLSESGLSVDYSDDLKHRNKGNIETQEELSSFSSVFQQAIEQAIRRCLPPRPGTRHRHLFKLARELKAILELAEVPALDLLPIVEKWHRLSLPCIRTKEFGVSWLEFLTMWQSVRFPAGTSPILEASRLAHEAPPVQELVNCGDDRLMAAAKLCRELQRQRGDRPFYLDCRTAAKVLKIDNHVTAWRCLKALSTIGVLEHISSGSQAKKKANEYRWRGVP